MTPGQWKVLREIVAKPEIRASEINRRTAEALVGQGAIEECPRMYFGPRTQRYRATALGRLAVEKADVRRQRRASIHATAGNSTASAATSTVATSNPADRPEGGA